MEKLDRKTCFQYCLEAGNETGLDPYLVYAIIETESNRIIDIQSKSGAIGLMQITDIARQEVNSYYGMRFTKEDMKYPLPNIRIGALYLNRWYQYFLSQSYENGIALMFAIMCYNWGYGNVQNWLENGMEDNRRITELLPFEKLQYNEDVMWWYAWAKNNLKEVL
jgi:soluble lytic murein transglycosylase